MALVSSMALQTTMGKPPFKYLGVINDGSNNQGYLEYSTDAVLSKCAKFDVETAHDGLVHIRSCLTNKYWVRSSTNGNWIVAKGLKPDADKNSWTCTLFRMEVDDDKRAKFYHVQSGCILRVPNTGKMLTIDPSASAIALSSVVDYDTLIVLPRYVAFKGSNGRYYNSCYTDTDTSLSFSLTDIGDPSVVCEIKYTNDGRVRLKAVAYTDTDAYWTYTESRDGILTSFGSDSRLWSHQVFEPIKVIDKNNTIALRCIANNKICMRVDHGDMKNCLVATARGLIRDTHLEIVEPVFRRTINLYEFDLDNARIYNVGPLYSAEHTWDNRSDETQHSTAEGKITITKTRSYNNSINVSGSVSATINAGIPFIAGGSVQVSASLGYSHQWGTTIGESQQIGDTFNVIVKPMKTTRARGVATMGTCDVPFSYVQKDYPSTGGPPIITKLYDGVFTGANAYTFYSQVWYEDLPPYNGPPHLAPAKKCVKRPMVAAVK